MKVIRKLSEYPDPWFGNNQILICQDSSGNFWKVHNNDSCPKDHPEHMRKINKVKKRIVEREVWDDI